jgi:hypothetical protein
LGFWTLASRYQEAFGYNDTINLTGAELYEKQGFFQNYDEIS